MKQSHRAHGARLAFGTGLVAASVLALAACSTSSASTNMAGVNVGTLGTVSRGTTLDKALSPALLSLPLTDEHGKTLTLGSLSGKTIVLVPFLTTCQETCPMTSVNMRDIAAAVEASGQSSSIAELEVTVDPVRDDAARMAAYQGLYGSQPGWDLVTAGTRGTPALWQELGVYYGKVAENNPPPMDWQTGKILTYDVAHQDVVFVIDGHGHIRWLTSGAPNTAGVNPPPTQMKFMSDVGRKNLTSPPEPSWTVADVDSALSTVTGHHIAG